MRVLAAAQQLGYRPNATARALASRRTHSLGLVSNFLGEEPNLYFLEVFSGVIQGAAAAEQTTAVFTLGDWADGPTRIPALCDGRVDGLILLAPRLPDDGTPWLPERTPLVSVQADRPVGGAVNVNSDDEAGAYSMVSRLLELGHRRILHVGGPSEFSGANQRAAGYLRAHADAGVKPAPDHLVHTQLSVDGGRAALESWLRREHGRPMPEAIFGCNDAIALGCMDVLRARGVRVPDQVSVVGYDHTLMARWMHLSTVRQPLHEMGRRAVEVLLQQIEAMRSGQPYLGPKNIVFPIELIAGGTVAAPRLGELAIA